MLPARSCRHALGCTSVTSHKNETAIRHGFNCSVHIPPRCIIARASASSGDFEQELREQIRELARQGWTFKKSSNPANTKQPSKASRIESDGFSKQGDPHLGELTDAPRPSSSLHTQISSPSTVDASIAGFDSPPAPALQPPPVYAAATAQASTESVQQPSSTSTNPDTVHVSATATTSAAVPQSSPFADRLGYSVATGTDLPSLTKSIIATLNKDDGCWVAAASPSNCTLALQAITSARKAAIHAGLFEIVFQPSMTPQPDAEPRLEFFLTKYELDNRNETLIEGPSVFPGTWPKDDADFGQSIVDFLEEEQQVILRCGGVNHSSQAARALVIAQNILQQQEVELQVSPEWHVGKDRAVKLDLLVELIELDEVDM